MANGHVPMPEPSLIGWSRVVINLGGWGVVAYAFLAELPKMTAAVVKLNDGVAQLERTNADVLREVRGTRQVIQNAADKKSGD